MARRRKKKTKGSKEEPIELIKAPHSFVIHRGTISKSLEQLLLNVRKIMEPFTATKLKVRKKNTIKDFISISNYLNVTHMIIFTESNISPYIRLCRVPNGPTLTYRILNATLSNEILSKQKYQQINTKLFQNSPLLILNGFTVNNSNDENLNNCIQLQTSMWRNMFATIDIEKVQLSKIYRCLLLSLNNETNIIELRHYAIKCKPLGLTKMIKKLITSKKIPDLGKYQSVEDIVIDNSNNNNNNNKTDDEDDDDDEQLNDINEVIISQKLNNNNKNLLNEKSSIKLYEIGPRITMKLIKIENNIMSGEVLYHSFIKLNEKELLEQRKLIEEKRRLRLMRKKQQEANVQRKKMLKNQNNQNKDNDNKNSNKNSIDSEEDDDDDDQSKRKKFKSNDDDNKDNDDDDECSDYQISDDEMNMFNDDDDDD